MQKNNEIDKLPLIENILILGLNSDDLNSIQSSDINDIEENSSKYKSTILSDYSLFNKLSQDDFYKKICDLSFPCGTVISSQNINYNKKQYISFSIKDSNGHLKHITCTYIQSGLKINDGNIITINTGIALISFLDIFECHKEILSHIIDIITNYFIMNSSNNNKKLREIFCDNKLFEEYRLLPFYFSFFLNLTLNNHYNMDKIKNICLMNIPNNYFQNIFCKIGINAKTKNAILSLKEYDTSILLEKFYIEDIIKLYYALLLDKSIIFLFNDFYDINIIINSLLSITFPLDKSKKYNINYIYNKLELQSKKLIKKDQLNTIYLIYYTDIDDLSFLPEEGNTPSILSSKNTNINSLENNLNENSNYNTCLNFYYHKDCLVYSFKEKKFLNCPIDIDKGKNKNIFVEEEINDEMKSLLYFTMGEKLIINSDMNFDETDLGQIFDNSTCNKINSFLYLNLKIKKIFFSGFLMIMNGLNSVIDFNYKFNKDNFSITEFFDIKNNFIKGNRLKHYLIKNKNFQEFLISYIKKHKTNEKYIFIYKTLNEIRNKNFIEINKHLDKLFKDHIRNGIINYYNFDYISLEKCFKDLLNTIEIDNKDNDNKNNIENYLLNSNTNYTLYQLLNIDTKKIEKNNSYFKNHVYKDYLEKDILYLKKFQLYIIYNSVKIMHRQELSKLYSLKPPILKVPIESSIKNININKNNKKEKNKIEKKNKLNLMPNIDNIFGQILKVEVFPNIKKDSNINIYNNKDQKIELSSESKKIKFKKINKDSSYPVSKDKSGNAVGRNFSYYNCFNHPFTKNSNQISKRKNFQLSNGKEIKKTTQSFREKNTISKPKNKFNKFNAFIETDYILDNYRERSSKRKYTYNIEESNHTLKKFGINKNTNNSNRIRKDKIKKQKYGPNSSSKKYENNFGHLPKLAGDLDDNLISDEDSNK